MMPAADRASESLESRRRVWIGSSRPDPARFLGEGPAAQASELELGEALALSARERRGLLRAIDRGHALVLSWRWPLRGVGTDRAAPEALDELIEVALGLRARAVLWRFSPTFWNEGRGREVIRAVAGWPLERLELAIDPGREGAPRPDRLDWERLGALTVEDPLWEPLGSARGSRGGGPGGRAGEGRLRWFWKLHGWHEARWIRRYGPDQLDALARQIARRESAGLPGICIFAHSGREEECSILISKKENRLETNSA